MRHGSVRYGTSADKLNVLSLFSGIGAFDLGLEWSGGFETVAFCETDNYCRGVLARHWPNVRQYGDVRELTADTLRRDGIAVDVICAGFPCQGISAAGKRAGLADERSGLWSEVARLAREIRPSYVVLENSEQIRRNGLWQVLSDLASLGFDALWHCIPAAYVGARHIRDRMWAIGFLPDASGERLEQCWREQFKKASIERRGLHLRFNEPEPPRVAYGVARRMDRTRVTGNALVPHIPLMIGRAILQSREVGAA